VPARRASTTSTAGTGNVTLDGETDTDTINGGAGIDSATNGENVTNVP
jgi:hypothetical protein